MTASGHSLPSQTTSEPTFVRVGPKATFPGMGPNGREVPIPDKQLSERQFGSPAGATLAPAGPTRSMARCTNPDAFASSTNSLM